MAKIFVRVEGRPQLSEIKPGTILSVGQGAARRYAVAVAAGIEARPWNPNNAGSPKPSVSVHAIYLDDGTPLMAAPFIILEDEATVLLSNKE